MARGSSSPPFFERISPFRGGFFRSLSHPPEVFIDMPALRFFFAELHESFPSSKAVIFSLSKDTPLLHGPGFSFKGLAEIRLFPVHIRFVPLHSLPFFPSLCSAFMWSATSVEMGSSAGFFFPEEPGLFNFGSRSRRSLSAPLVVETVFSPFVVVPFFLPFTLFIIILCVESFTSQPRPPRGATPATNQSPLRLPPLSLPPTTGRLPEQFAILTLTAWEFHSPNHLKKGRPGGSLSGNLPPSAEVKHSFRILSWAARLLRAFPLRDGASLPLLLVTSAKAPRPSA